MMNNKTGIRYLHIDHRKKFGHNYVVRVIITGKPFIVWVGNDIEIGKKVAKKVQELTSISKLKFLDWYDNYREEWLKSNGY